MGTGKQNGTLVTYYFVLFRHIIVTYSFYTVYIAAFFKLHQKNVY